jgi:hypothetical protein
MKRIIISAVMVSCALLALPLLAQDMPDTSNAKEGEIRGTIGIGMGASAGSYLIVFPVNTPWVDTGVDVAAGDAVTIVTAPSQNHPPCDGRTGCPPYRKADAIIVDGALGKGLTAVVGRISAEGKAFSVGKEYAGTVSEPGRLYIGYNDCWACWGDNTGAFEVTITVTKK